MATKIEHLEKNSADNSKERLLVFGSLENENENENGRSGCMCSFKSMQGKITELRYDLQEFSRKVWEMGRSDPRKFIFAIKMGVALSIVSMLIFCKELSPDINQYSIWAILTVVVMFEFSIGATFIKGFNRGLGTLCAAILATFFAELSLLAGKGEQIVIVISVFITASCSAYLKLYPTMSPYEYGFRVFILTYCILMVAGNRNGDYTDAIVTRLVLIAVGAGVTLAVNICIYPIWAGEDLHRLVVTNFRDVATSLEGCVSRYLEYVEYERIPSKILTYQAFDDPLYKGYRSAVESTSREATLLGFAIWEPPHGCYKMFNYPWRNYVKVSGALRHCAFMVMALHGCILSEIQAPAERRLVFRSELQRVGAEGAKVLRELANRVEKMEKLSPGNILKEVHEAAEQLQKKIDNKSYLLVNSESWEIGSRHNELKDPENSHDEKNFQLGFKSLSEAVLDLRSANGSSDDMFRKQIIPWPSRLSLTGDAVIKDDEIRTYQSASALSLATFASLLIEFVARLQNVVDSFQELSEKARFKDPTVNPVAEVKRVVFWTKLIRFFRFKN
ncbi:aluminum-activated malate transporter 9-like [Cornus florida]|uniref:aluminum-activated malate transporter 9-like n=1 Tax=Cornus florida TaxID=4283 RepID=UPI00289E92F4|nr:aluminum-activated malate transporter 9-like [Cornus florida]